MSDPTCGQFRHYRQFSNRKAGLYEYDCACTVPCPTCGAHVGRLCVNATSTGGWSTGTQAARMHRSRFEAANVKPVLITPV